MKHYIVCCLFVLIGFLCGCSEELSLDQVYKYQDKFEYQKAYACCEKLVAEKVPGAKVELANMISVGLGCEPDYRAGQKLIEEAAKERDFSALYAKYCFKVNENPDDLIAMLKLSEETTQNGSDWEKINAYKFLIILGQDVDKSYKYQREVLKILDKLPNTSRKILAKYMVLLNSGEERKKFLEQINEDKFLFYYVLAIRQAEGRYFKKWTQKDLDLVDRYIKYLKGLPQKANHQKYTLLAEIYSGFFGNPENLKLAEKYQLLAFKEKPNVFIMEGLTRIYSIAKKYDLMDKYALMALEEGYVKPLLTSFTVLAVIQPKNDSIKELFEKEMQLLMDFENGKYAGVINDMLRKECVNNLKKMGVSLSTFAKDNDNNFPATLDDEKLKHYGYGVTPQKIVCPIDGTPYKYAGNIKVAEDKKSTTPLIWCPNVEKHQNTEIIGFANGRCETKKLK